MRRILHIDMDAFFAAVEERRRPELAGKPVVIGGGGDPSRRGVVSTANYEARKFHVHSGMPLRTAFKLCPRAVFLPVDYETYSRISRVIKEVLRGVSPVMEDVGIDEAYLEVTGHAEPDEAIAHRIKTEVREKTGLTCSIGIAPNKLLAKIASDLQKPDGVTIIGAGDVESRLWPLAIRKLYGVGPKTEASLKAMGVETIGQLAAFPREALVERFGNSYGGYLHEASRGSDESPLVTHWEPKSMSRETTFQEDVDNWQVIARTLADLAREVTVDLRENHTLARTVTIKIRFADFTTFTRALTMAGHTDSEEGIRKAAFACLKRIDLDRKVRLVGVRLSSLAKEPEEEIFS
ncbi:MAG: DNA polymerase IV [Syntrophales bacterium]